MRKVSILLHNLEAGTLIEEIRGERYRFHYHEDYQGPPVSLVLPFQKDDFEFSTFPSFLDGLLPEGEMLEALLRQKKIDKDDYLSQLVAVGADLVGAITVQVIE
jgi:serine/threonine-protein kinase HipA